MSKLPKPGGDARRALSEIIAQHDTALLHNEDVVGVAEGQGPDGQPIIKVLLAAANRTTQSRLPKQIDGYPVVTEVVGEIRTQ